MNSFLQKLFFSANLVHSFKQAKFIPAQNYTVHKLYQNLAIIHSTSNFAALKITGLSITLKKCKTEHQANLQNVLPDYKP
jgi:hypothetical protein